MVSMQRDPLEGSQKLYYISYVTNTLLSLSFGSPFVPGLQTTMSYDVSGTFLRQKYFVMALESFALVYRPLRIRPL